VRRSLAAGAAAAVVDGVADSATEDVAARVAEGVGVADSIAAFVEFDNNGDSGKKRATNGTMLEGRRMLKVCACLKSDSR
jgi:hypothetical protein